MLWYPGAQNPEQHPYPGGLSQSRDVSPWNRSTAQDVLPVAALGLTTNRPHGDSSGDVMVGFAHHMHHDVKKNNETVSTTKNKIRNDWIRLFVRAEMAAVKEPGRQPARRASRPVPSV